MNLYLVESGCGGLYKIRARDEVEAKVKLCKFLDIPVWDDYIGVKAMSVTIMYRNIKDDEYKNCL